MELLVTLILCLIMIAPVLAVALWYRRHGISLRRLVFPIAAGLMLGVATAAAVHAEHKALVTLLGLGLFLIVVLAVVSTVLAYNLGSHPVVKALFSALVIALVALPALFASCPLIFRLDLLRAKRFFAQSLAPQWEAQRASSGHYPRELSLFRNPPPGSPWLVSRFSYFSNGSSYSLSVMNPGRCGQVVSFSSDDKVWRETYKPCYY